MADKPLDLPLTTGFTSACGARRSNMAFCPPQSCYARRPSPCQRRSSRVPTPSPPPPPPKGAWVPGARGGTGGLVETRRCSRSACSRQPAPGRPGDPALVPTEAEVWTSSPPDPWSRRPDVRWRTPHRQPPPRTGQIGESERAQRDAGEDALLQQVGRVATLAEQPKYSCKVLPNWYKERACTWPGRRRSRQLCRRDGRLRWRGCKRRLSRPGSAITARPGRRPSRPASSQAAAAAITARRASTRQRRV